MKVLNRCWLWSLGAGLTPFLFASASFGQAAVPVVPTGHSVFDLHANRTLAHIEQRGGLVLIGGSAGFARYAHFGRPTASWKLRSEVDGKKVALPTTAARLQVPLHPGQTQNQSVFLSLKSPSKSSLKISVGGKSSAAVPLNEGWQLVTVPLPADSLHAGENTLSLTFAQSGTFALTGGSGSHKAAAAVEWIQVGGSTPPANPPLPKLSDGSRLLIPSGGALHYYAYVPKGGALAVIGHVERAWGYSFAWEGAGRQPTAFIDVFMRLMAGHTVGAATEPLNVRYAELAAGLAEELELARTGVMVDEETLAMLWTATNDARSYVILGDPAVHIPLAKSDE